MAWLLLRDRRMNRQSKAVWLVLPITVVLTNLHFFFVFRPALDGGDFSSATLWIAENTEKKLSPQMKIRWTQMEKCHLSLVICHWFNPNLHLQMTKDQ